MVIIVRDRICSSRILVSRDAIEMEKGYISGLVHERMSIIILWVIQWKLLSTTTATFSLLSISYRRSFRFPYKCLAVWEPLAQASLVVYRFPIFDGEL